MKKYRYHIYDKQGIPKIISLPTYNTKAAAIKAAQKIISKRYANKGYSYGTSSVDPDNTYR